jgi:hypothetical protein
MAMMMEDIIARLDRIKWLHGSPTVSGIILDAKQTIVQLRIKINQLQRENDLMRDRFKSLTSDPIVNPRNQDWE